MLCCPACGGVLSSNALMHARYGRLNRHDELVNITLANMGMEAIFQEQGLVLSEDEIKAEMSDAADEFMAAGEEFDDGRLREQVVEVLKVSLCMSLWLYNGCTCMLGAFLLGVLAKVGAIRECP